MPQPVSTAQLAHDARQVAATGYGSEAYWPEIDGLRAIAILLVVGFHAGVAQLSGGFIGVDVFFVISGYLITGLLAREHERNGRIDILDFYARRARRLMPALSVVLAATLVAGAVLLVPVGEQQELAQSAISASGFLANVFFWRSQSSYFAGPSDEIPLLHLWTLAVEEQFYIVWPLAMIAVAALARRFGMPAPAWTVAALVVASLVSFAGCVWLTPSRATLTFYTTPFRAWEFGLGALLALTARHWLAAARSPPAPAVGGVLIAAGLAAVVLAGVWFDRSTVFPGAAAAVPVLGTTAVIAGLGFARGSLAARLLASPPMVGIGKLSYSWYLWHWPLLALARAAMPGEASASRDLVLVLVALGLSAITYRLIEEPIRRNRPWPFSTAGASVAAGVLLMVTTAGLAAALWTSAELRVARDPVLRAASIALTEKADPPPECMNFRLPFAGLAPRDVCTTDAPGNANGPAPLVLLWGDSHAHHFIPGLTQWARASGARLLPRTMGACKPHIHRIPAGVSARVRADSDSCVAFNTAVRAELNEIKAAGGAAVVLAARWSVPSQVQDGLGDWGADLATLIASIQAAGLAVVVLAETPARGLSVPHCVARNGAVACDRKRGEVDAERAAALDVLARVARGFDGVTIWDPVDAVCTSSSCPALQDGIVLYSDFSHLSVAASRTLGPSLSRVLDPVIAPRR